MSRQRNRDDRLAAFLQASQAMASSLDLDQVLRTVVEAAAAISGAPFVRLFLLEGAPPMLHWRVGVGLSPEGEPNRPIRIGESFSGQVAVTGQPLAVADCREDPRLRFPEHIQRYSLISYLGLPVKTGDRLLGVLCFNTNAPHVYTEEEISFLNAFAQQAAVAIQNAQLHREEQRRRQQLEAVRAVAAEITRELDLTLLLQLIIRRAVDLTGAQAGSLSLWDEGAQILRHRAWVGYDDWLANVTLRPGEGVKGAVAQRRAGMIVNDYPASPVAYPPFVERLGTTAVLAEPLLYQNRLLGVVSVDMREPGRRFSGEDRKVLALFADQAAVAIENAQLYETSRAQANELQAVAEIGQAVSRHLELPAVLNAIVAGTMRLLDNPFAQILLWDEERQRLTYGAVQGPEAQRVMGQQFELGRGINGEVAQTRQPMILEDYQGSPYAVPECADVVATITVPICAGDRLLGVLHSHTTQADRRFTQDDLRLLQSLAAHAAIAIANARAYDVSARRTKELEALLRASRSVMAGLDLRVTLARIVAEAAAMAGTPLVKVLLRDESTQHFTVAAAKSTVTLPGAQFPVGAGLSGIVAATGEPLFVPDTPADPRNLFAGQDRALGVVTYLGLPIKDSRGGVRGVLTFNTTEPRQYTAADLAYLGAFAAHAALAIENARLHEATQHELAERIRAEEGLRRSEEQARRLAQENATMAELGRLISSTPHLEEVYENFADEARKVLRFDRIVINRIDVEKNLVQNLFVAGERLQGRTSSDPYPLAGSSNAEMVRTRASLLIQTDDFGPYAERFPGLISTFQAGFRSILNVPLFAQGRVIGGLLLRSRQPNAYTGQDVRLAERIASQIAGTVTNAQLYLENVHLYEAAQREIAERRQAEEILAVRTRHLEAVRSISEEIVRELDLTTVLDLIIQRAVTLVGATSGSIRLWDEGQQLLTPVARTGSDRHAATVPLRLGEGVAGTAAQQRRGLIVNDFRTSAYAMPALLEETVHTAVIATPLLYGERLVGVLVISREAIGPPFVDADLEALNLFAPHAAVAIENARLHAAALQRGEELGALLRAGRVVMDGLNLDETLDRIIREASAIARAPHVKILLADTEDGTLRLAAVLGRPAEMMGQFDYAGRGSLSGVVAKTGHPLFVPDCQHDPRNIAAEQDSLLGIQTYLGLPIKSRGEILGVLTFNTTEPRQYTPGEIEYLSSFADQAAIAIENARLYEEVQRHAGELETRVKERTAELEEALRVKAEFLAKVSHELRTPLNFVLGFSDLLREQIAGPLTDKQMRFVDRIYTGGRQLLDLVSDLLNLSRVEMEERPLRFEEMSLAPLIQGVLSLYSIPAGQRHLTLGVNVPPTLRLVAERHKLIQIVTNLVGNAVKFTPEGGSIRVTARQVLGKESRGAVAQGSRGEEAPLPPGPSAPLQSVEIAVEDTGIGLAPQDLERIFRGFDQVDGSSTRQYGGTGIGLALVRTLVELHGGSVWAESGGLGQGARFIVRIPCLKASPPRRILVVEDEAAILKFLCIFLRDAGYAVTGAGSGAEALAAVAADLPNLVVLDIGLPDMSGWEVLRQLRAETRTASLPVLVLMGVGESQAEQAKALGALEFLTKPFSPPVLLKLVGDLMTGSGRPVPPEQLERPG